MVRGIYPERVVEKSNISRLQYQTTHPKKQKMIIEQKYLDLLKKYHVSSMPHSNRSLIEHLIGTFNFLKAWGNSDALCLAGLFHSIYGTKSYQLKAVALEERASIKSVIGGKAEAIAYLFGISDRTSFFEGLLKGHTLLKNRHTNEIINIDTQEAKDLLEVEVANLMDQYEYISLTQFSESILAFSQLQHLVSNGAKQAIIEHIAMLESKTIQQQDTLALSPHIDFERFENFETPFSYSSTSHFFHDSVEKDILAWFQSDLIPWKLTEKKQNLDSIEKDFYEQHEARLIPEIVVDPIKDLLLGENTLKSLKAFVSLRFKTELEDEVDAAIHKLLKGQRIRIHNDKRPHIAEAYRLVIQINDKWPAENGGNLLFFGSGNPQDIRKIFKPISNSAVVFKISQDSFHAVTEIKGGERYTLVYTFLGKTRGSSTVSTDT